jgi:RimJ/RimL family protein N-acetyltransferase
VIHTSTHNAVLPQLSRTQSLSTEWREQLPVLHAGSIRLRELKLSDAASLHALLTTAEVTRFISPPPATVEGFERFIAWTQRERAAGAYVCFAIVPEGSDTAVGLFQIRQLDPSFETAEWGFALAQTFWGTGVFAAAAPAVVDFAFGSMQIKRLEARSSVENGRGNGALRKIGATREAYLQRSFLKDGRYQDQLLWSIRAEDWRLLQSAAAGLTH